MNIYNSDTNKLIENFITHVNKAATIAMGIQKQGHQNKTSWWNGECKKAIKESKTALAKYKKCNTLENFIDLKKYKTKTRQIIQQAKTNS